MQRAYCLVTCGQTVLLPFCLGEEGGKDVLIHVHLLYVWSAVVQDLDFCLIGQKQESLRTPAVIGYNKHI